MFKGPDEMEKGHFFSFGILLNLLSNVVGLVWGDYLTTRRWKKSVLTDTSFPDSEIVLPD